MKKFLLVVGLVSVVFGSQLCAGDTFHCAEDELVPYQDDGWIRFPPPQEIKRKIAAVGFSRFARKSRLSNKLFPDVCILMLEHLIKGAIDDYIKRYLTRPNGIIKKHRALEAQMLRECWPTTILPALLDRTPEDFMLGPDGNGPLKF